ncbi:MAG: SRPBCC domain-containing protein [Bacteriovoracaceae bacterium]|nr:SRPBCC domain-containing protein [Bacteriovoracaceae bacterium]
MSSYLEAIEYKTYIDAPVEEVFATITSAQGWDAWFTCGTYLDLESKEIVFRWKDFGADKITTNESAEIKEFVQNERFSYSWHGGVFDQPTVVSFNLRPQNKGTLIVLEDRGYPRSEKGESWFMDCACGWGEALTLLKVYLETGYRYINY